MVNFEHLPLEVDSIFSLREIQNRDLNKRPCSQFARGRAVFVNITVKGIHKEHIFPSEVPLLNDTSTSLN